MKLVGPLLVVADMERSKHFYETVLLQKVRFDLGANQQFESGLMLQTKDSWSGLSTIPDSEITTGTKNVELYFETEDLADALRRLEDYGPVRYVHPLKEFEWGQRSVAFYDPDGYIVELGETIESVCRRFLKDGKSVEETARITEFPEAFVRGCL